MRPIFKYDPVRACLLVWMEASEADTGEAAGRDRMFFVSRPLADDDLLRVVPGACPPLYVPPIPDRLLISMLYGDPVDLHGRGDGKVPRLRAEMEGLEP